MKSRKRPAKRHALRRGKSSTAQIGENIRTARSNAGITQLALAHAIGYNGDDAGAYISRVESGAQEPRLDTLSRIAEALGVTTCSLLPG